MSNLWRSEIEKMDIGVAYEMAVQFGELLTYTPRSGSGVSVYGFPESGGDTRMRDTIHTRSQEDKRSFQIMEQPPNLPTWPPSGAPMVDDTITDEDGFVYAIRQWSCDAVKGVYTFTDCVRTITKQVGMVGQ